MYSNAGILPLQNTLCSNFLLATYYSLLFLEHLISYHHSSQLLNMMKFQTCHSSNIFVLSQVPNPPENVEHSLHKYIDPKFPLTV